MKILHFLLLLFVLLMPLLSHGSSPYAPEKVGTQSEGSDIGAYTYDTGGNRLTKTVDGANSPSQTIAMDLTTKPSSITTSSGTNIFKNGLGGRRYLRVHADNPRKTFYLSGMEYRIENGSAKSVVFIRAKGYSPDVQVELTNGRDPQYTYLIKDHLGSPMRTVNNTGAVGNPARFDPWGQEVATTGVATLYDTPEKVQQAEKIRGYTGHELVASANMGHWNGRIFDYEIGAFPGPDKFIQGHSIAALNRYALGHNNNPNVTDPSGWVPEWLRCLGCTGRGAEEAVAHSHAPTAQQRDINRPMNRTQTNRPTAGPSRPAGSSATSTPSDLRPYQLVRANPAGGPATSASALMRTDNSLVRSSSVGSSSVGSSRSGSETSLISSFPATPLAGADRPTTRVGNFANRFNRFNSAAIPQFTEPQLSGRRLPLPQGPELLEMQEAMDAGASEANEATIPRRLGSEENVRPLREPSTMDPVEIKFGFFGPRP